MPTVLRIGPYRLFFYSEDGHEPEHVHVERDDKVAKFWLDPIRLQENGGFSRSELGDIDRMVREHQIQLSEAWRGYFKS